MTHATNMGQSLRLRFGVALTLASVAAVTGLLIIPRYGFHRHLGSGHAYAILGELPVHYRNRVQPLSSMAREVVKHIHGRSAIRLESRDGGPGSSWEPVAAVLDWSVRPDDWNEEDLILVDDRSLRRMLLKLSILDKIRALTREATPSIAETLRELAAKPDLTRDDLRGLAHQAGEESPVGKSLEALADRLGDPHDCVSPRVLESIQLEYEGHTLTFPEWIAKVLDKKDRVRQQGVERLLELTPIEEAAARVGERYFLYRALRDHQSAEIRSLDLLVIPRPSNGSYLAYSAEAFENGMMPDRGLSPLEANVANILADYLQGLPSKEWALPREDPIFDQKFSLWLGGRAPWMPLGILLDSDASEFPRAGIPPAQVRAFLKSYRDFEAAERAEPGNVPEPIATALVTTARDLGSSLSDYADSAAMARESLLNRLAPFFWAPVAYGFALATLVLSFGCKAELRTASGKLGATFYGLGLAGLMVGVSLDLYGFAIRSRIARWGPVTNLYDSVVWVALATTLLGLALELLWRKKYAALAASAIALVASVLAENAPPLDSSILDILPVLRLNRWIAGHVLPIVSSYAAFALALGLGLMAVGYDLTATYRRSPSYRELGWPLLPGIPLLLIGRFSASSRPGLSHSIWPSQAGPWLAAIGGFLAVVGGFGLLGEFANRSPRRALGLGLILTALGLSLGISGAVPGHLADALLPYDEWSVGAIGVVLTLMSRLAVDPRDAIARIEPIAVLISRSMLIGVLLLATGMILGAAWARLAWGRLWGWDPKEVWALITLFAYLIPLFGRLLGWINTNTLVTASVACFMAVLVSWYGLNFNGVGLHSYGFADGMDRGIMLACPMALFGSLGAAAWRRSRSK